MDPHPDLAVEIELQQDLIYYGSCYWKLEDGRKVRIDPREVYIAIAPLPWWKRLLAWLLKIVPIGKRSRGAFSASEGAKDG